MQHPSIWLLRHDASCLSKPQTHGALNVKQMAVYDSRWLGDGKLHNMTHCENINWSLTLADNREVLELHYAAKQHLVYSIWGKDKGHLERSMLKQWPTFDITRSNWHPVRALVNKVQLHFIQSGRDNIPWDIISTTVYLIQSFWNSLIRCRQEISIFFQWQSMSKVVYMGQFPYRECGSLLTNGQSPVYLLPEAIAGCI
jgi:hypothetical protein